VHLAFATMPLGRVARMVMTIVLHVRQFLIRQKSAANHDRTRPEPHLSGSKLVDGECASGAYV